MQQLVEQLILGSVYRVRRCTVSWIGDSATKGFVNRGGSSGSERRMRAVQTDASVGYHNGDQVSPCSSSSSSSGSMKMAKNYYVSWW